MVLELLDNMEEDTKDAVKGLPPAGLDNLEEDVKEEDIKYAVEGLSPEARQVFEEALIEARRRKTVVYIV